MIYYNPNQVVSPRDLVSDVRPLFDGGDDSVSIAKIKWDGVDCFAMRWNIAAREWNDPEKISHKKICVGMPSSRGYPVWFVLPNYTDKEIEKLIERLKE